MFRLYSPVQNVSLGCSRRNHTNKLKLCSDLQDLDDREAIFVPWVLLFLKLRMIDCSQIMLLKSSEKMPNDPGEPLELRTLY